MTAAAVGELAIADPIGDPIMERLEDQLAWYDKKSRTSMRYYKRIKVTEIIAAALIPLIASSRIPHAPVITAGFGVLITVLEGILQLNQYQQNWILYRSTCEYLKHEKYCYLGSAPPYAGAANPHSLLAERMESLVSQEHAKWASVHQQEVKK